jgi:ATP-dependent helicase/nuclease subunit B
MSDFREGIMTDRPAEKYRTERLKEICTGIAWSMIRQVQQGQIKEMYFEQSFGRNKPLPPVKVQVGDQEVLIKGTIDRLDVLDSEGGETVRIIDYKTGGDFIDPQYMRSGYKLQLMIYLAAAQKEPAGVFYFKIKDIDIDADRVKVDYEETDINERIASSYKLEGIMVNDFDLLEAMTGQINGSSDVIPVKYSKKDSAFVASSGGHLMSKEEFNELYEAVGRQVDRICQEICDGNIAIAPKVEHEKDINGGLRVSCKYCNYKSICMFDTSFDGCKFQEV